jgi:small toxic polypeptide LdrA/B/C/D
LVSTWQRIGLNLASPARINLATISRDSRERLPLQQGGCMTLAQLGLVLWDDLAAPVIAGILVSIIVSRMDNRK